MTQITTTLYKLIAEDYATIWEQLQLVDDNALLAVNHIVDVTTTGYTPGAAAALEIELLLLAPFDAAREGMSVLANNTTSLISAVKTINGHVISNTTGTDIPKVKLDTWVNTTMTEWHSGVPNGWQELSQSAGYDTSDWNINPSIIQHSH